MIQKVDPANTMAGVLTPPPDKSISHRSALFAAISDKTSTIDNYSEAADPQSTLSCLTQLGVPVEKKKRRVLIQGVGRDGFKNPGTPLDCGNSGTTMRLLAGIVAGAGIECELIGDASLSSRTMKRIIDPLTKMGCAIEGSEGEFAPLKITSHSGINAIHFPLPVASAQVKSAVLLAGLYGDKPTKVVEPVPTRDHTERLLGLNPKPLGSGKMITSSRKNTIPAQNYTVPGDFSAAAFWLVAGTIHHQARIQLHGVGINPSRTAVFHLLEKMGAHFTLSKKKQGNRNSEPVADIAITSSPLKPINPDSSLIPNCIDELPILMVAMCFADGTSVISGAEELRHKETDRLAAMSEILTAAGAKTELKHDGIIIHGNNGFTPNPARYSSCHDHRMAMAAAILASKAREPSEIEDAECTAISYPEFWNHLREMSR